LIVFDGMDWQTTQAAAIYQSGKIYESGRGSGLAFQDYAGTVTDYGYFVTSPHNTGTDVDVNSQTVVNPGGTQRGGYDASIGGPTPWARPQADEYLLGQLRRVSHAVTDSACSATSLTAGIKTYNAAINVDYQGEQVVPIARQLQAEKGFAIGVVSSVPISHATPASAYSNNVHRDDYQDLSRDLVGLPSIAHRTDPLPGVDVLIGGGWGEDREKEDKQGDNYVSGNKYLPQEEIDRLDHANGGKYVIAQRTPGKSGSEVLLEAARQAYENDLRLFGFFGVSGGQLPFRTADGNYNPTTTRYSQADITENPTLADMTRAALGRLSKNKNGFWLMIESGDVDWANHSNNLDDSIGAVISGDEAFQVVTAWVEKNNAWDDTVVIVTADHGHYFVLQQPEVLVPPSP
jgi:alkaline phosphatase